MYFLFAEEAVTALNPLPNLRPSCIDLVMLRSSIPHSLRQVIELHPEELFPASAIDILAQVRCVVYTKSSIEARHEYTT
jgi:hypothetical protein